MFYLDVGIREETCGEIIFHAKYFKKCSPKVSCGAESSIDDNIPWQPPIFNHVLKEQLKNLFCVATSLAGMKVSYFNTLSTMTISSHTHPTWVGR